MDRAAMAPRRCTICMCLESIGIPAVRSVVNNGDGRREETETKAMLLLYASSNRDKTLAAEAPLLELCGERM
jgi:hypothetical protein